MPQWWGATRVVWTGVPRFPWDRAASYTSDAGGAGGGVSPVVRWWILLGCTGCEGWDGGDLDVPAVTRLVTSVDVDADVADARSVSVSARHEAVLEGGRRVLLLDDRGWTTGGPPDVWAVTSVQDVVETARTVVGPDEPFGGRSQEDMEVDHWAHLVELLEQQGVAADAEDLQRCQHEVVLGEGLLARLGHHPGGAHEAGHP